MLSARRQFLDAFLGAFGAVEILDYYEMESQVRGTARFASDSEQLDLTGCDEDEDFQDFCWRIAEADAPEHLVYRIVDAIHRYQLLSVDRLRVSPEALYAILLQDQDGAVSRAEFDAALGALQGVLVTMVTDGVEDDDFRIRC